MMFFSSAISSIISLISILYVSTNNNQRQKSTLYSPMEQRKKLKVHSSQMELKTIPTLGTILDANDNPENDHVETPLKRKIPINKQIQACGKNYDAAVNILLTAYPYISKEHDELAIEMNFWRDLDPKSIASTIDILANTNQPSTALKILDGVIEYVASFHEFKYTSKETTNHLHVIYKSAIRMIGITSSCTSSTHTKNLSLVTKYLNHDFPMITGSPTPIDLYHVAMSAFGRAKYTDGVMQLMEDLEQSKTIRIERILENDQTIDGTVQKTNNVLEYTLPKPDKYLYQTALTACIRCKLCIQAVNFLSKMKNNGMLLDTVNYNQVLSALAQSGDMEKGSRATLAMKILDEMESQQQSTCNQSVLPNANTFELILSICAKEKAWDLVSEIMHRVNKPGSDINSLSPMEDNTSMKRYNTGLEALERIGKGREAWYKIGTYKNNAKSLDFAFGLQTHRNPVLNGLSLVFHDEKSHCKFGYLLIRNSMKNDTIFSSLLGMYIDDEHRGKGLANLFMAIWLKLCIQTNAIPRTEKINKPLLSLVLKKFGFLPREGGVIVEICPIKTVPFLDNWNTLNYEPLFALYSPTLKPTDGCFGERELRIQKMVVIKDKPNPRGKEASVKIEFDHPISSGEDEAKRHLDNCIQEIFGGEDKIVLPSCDILRHSLFGYLL